MEFQGAMVAPRRVTHHAVLSVLGGFLALFCTVGYLNAFGVFQQHYTSSILQDKTQSDISWIGSVTIFLLYLFAPITGILVDRVGPRWLLVGGSLGTLLSVFMTSLCMQYYQFLLAQGVLQGISMSFLTWPPMAVVARSLPTHRGLALGIVVGGSSVGGVVWAVMLARLLDYNSLSFGWVMRIVGFIMLSIFAIVCLTVREPRQHMPTPTPKNSSPNSTGSESEFSTQDSPPIATKEGVSKSDVFALIKNPVFICLTGGLAIGNLGLFIPFFFISSYATKLGIDSQTSFYLISIINGASLIGRVGPGYLGDRFGHYNICLLAVFSSGITAFCLTAAQSLGGLIAISAVYGFTSGGACVARIAGIRMQGTAMGMFMGFLAPTYGYLSVSLFTGATLVGGSVLVATARLLLNRIVLSPV
ncbi:putative MFS monocarboxylate transporter [Podospora aff. communis PSN243]|uniref:MFS monocarboxylate transporter n=1 Tax=Podospora aff. communis PSN243 TaxID=3040156 RepID=A0AAV9G0U9_9PEZI|nr:putative MFS monocarboxylate transporter [Podospora aff. communis PSN243]